MIDQTMVLVTMGPIVLIPLIAIGGEPMYLLSHYEGNL